MHSRKRTNRNTTVHTIKEGKKQSIYEFYFTSDRLLYTIEDPHIEAKKFEIEKKNLQKEENC